MPARSPLLSFAAALVFILICTPVDAELVQTPGNLVHHPGVGYWLFDTGSLVGSVTPGTTGVARRMERLNMFGGNQCSMEWDMDSKVDATNGTFYTVTALWGGDCDDPHYSLNLDVEGPALFASTNLKLPVRVEYQAPPDRLPSWRITNGYYLGLDGTRYHEVAIWPTSKAVTKQLAKLSKASPQACFADVERDATFEDASGLSFIQVSKLKCLKDPVAHCTDGVRSFDETDVDCGGSHCPGCTTGQACVVNVDCGDPPDFCDCYQAAPPAMAVCDCL